MDQFLKLEVLKNIKELNLEQNFLQLEDFT